MTAISGMPLQESGGTFAQVDRDVPDPPAKAPDHLHFRVRRVLEMHAAHGPGAAGSGVVDLHYLALTQHGPKFLSAEEAGERAAGIPVRHRLYNLEICQRGIEDFHAVAQPNPASTASAT
jgi:hypothetical protein